MHFIFNVYVTDSHKIYKFSFFQPINRKLSIYIYEISIFVYMMAFDFPTSEI